MADLKDNYKKRRRNSKLHQLIGPITKLLLNEQNKNQLLLSENIDGKNPRKFEMILEKGLV